MREPATRGRLVGGEAFDTEQLEPVTVRARSAAAAAVPNEEADRSRRCRWPGTLGGMKAQPSAVRTQFVPVAGASLWTQTSGQGWPLVLCHGGPGMSDNLEPLAQMLNDLVTVHRFDQRAGGRSTGVGEAQTVAGSVADLEALRAHWGHRRWLVGGHSWGATLALCYTLAHPGRVTALLDLSGPGPKETATTYDRVRAAARLARLTDTERVQLLAAEHRLAEDGADQDAAASIARLLWLTDFADRSRAPDLTAEPLFA
jgi:proline iminopeptidase